MTKKQISLNIFLALFGIYIFYLSGFKGLGEFILAMFLYSVFFYAFYYMWKKIRKKEINSYKKYIPYFLEKISGMLLLLLLILGSFSYYNNEINPAKMPVYYLTNGEKSVIFQGMSHIGTENFYNGVIQNIINAKKRDYVLFFEGVRPGTRENHDKFDEAIGIEFKKDLYENLSKLYGLSNQKNEDFLELVNNLDFNIDLSIDDIIEEYEKKIVFKDGLAKETKVPIDMSSELIKMLSELNERELKVLVYINQGIMNFIIKSDKLRDFVTNNFGNDKLFDVILDKRNIVLSDAIIDSKYDKIIVIYGLMHFKGVLDILQKKDSNWKIEKVEYMYPIG